jgi:hypothetical protein
MLTLTAFMMRPSGRRMRVGIPLYVCLRCESGSFACEGGAVLVASAFLVNERAARPGPWIGLGFKAAFRRASSGAGGCLCRSASASHALPIPKESARIKLGFGTAFGTLGRPND